MTDQSQELNKFKVMRAWDKGRNKVAFVYRDEVTGNTRLGETTFINWFYVKKSDFLKHKSHFYKFREEKMIMDFEEMEKYYKIFIDTVHNDCFLNKDMERVWEYKNFNFNKMMEKLAILGVDTFEADVQLWKRWLIQDNVEIESEYRVLFYDIETDDRANDALTPGAHRILSIAAKSSDCNNVDGRMWFLCLKEDTDEAEKKLLENLAKLINSHDILIAFNGMYFDDPYIKARFIRYGITIDWRKKFFQDSCWTFKKYGPNLQSNSLDNIAKAILKRGKVDHTGMRIYDMWEKDRKLFKEYNVEDVQLMYEIECETGYLSSHRDICVAGMCSVDDLYVTRKIDNFVLKQAQEDNEYHFKTMVRTEEEVEAVDFAGAFVFPPKAGRYKHAKVFDFASLYPNVVKTFNISPDTLIHGDEDLPDDMIIKTITKHKFRKDFIGILPKVIMRFKDTRDHFKALQSKETPGSTMHKVYDRRQYVYKSFGLSFYGAMGEKHTRFYDVRIAESVTLSGQFFIKQCAEYLERNKIPVIYGDTDSVFVSGVSNVNHVPKILEKLNQLCEMHALKKFNCDECTLKMEYDKGFRTFLMLDAKKRYAGALEFVDGHNIEGFNMYVAGLEMKRTDACEVLKKEQKQLLELLLKDAEIPSTVDIRNVILELRDRVFSGKLTVEEITLAQKITKDLELYDGRQMHKMVALEMIADGKEVWMGNKVPYFIITLDQNKKPVPKPTYKFEGKYCESYYWNNKIFPALQRILSVVYPEIDWEGYLVKTRGGGEVKMGRANLW